MFKKHHVGVDENFGYRHTHTHRMLIYTFLQGLFMKEQETDKRSYHLSAMNLNLEEYFNFWLLCNCLCLLLCRTGRLVSRSHLKCYLELRWQ